MKKFNITVNGKQYEVEVEEIGGVSAPTRPAAPAPKAAPAPAAPKAAPAPAPKAAPAAPVEGETVTAPMPGKIFKLIKSEGDTVKAGDVVMILEAMKMENEITASADGTIKQIPVKEGAAVNPGDVLCVIG